MSNISEAGAFVQLFEFTSDRIDEWASIQERFKDAIGESRTTRWSILGADRDRPGTYVAIVEFPTYDAAMSNSNHEATGSLVTELTAICTAGPEFRNLDVLRALPY